MMAVWFIPALQGFVPFIQVKPLNGVTTETPKPQLTASNFVHATYGDSLEAWYNAHSTLRPWLVRLRNEWHYRAFHKIYAPDIVEGKSGYLFESIYLKEHSGLNYKGADSILYITRVLRKLTDTLQRKGIPLLVVIAPGKGSYYEEYLPDHYPPAAQTNYLDYRKLLASHQIPFIDMNAWFLQLKKTASFPLYPQHGIHWSNYGGLLAADSVLKKAESLTGKSFGRFLMSRMKTEHHARFWDDADLWNLLNLFYRWDDGDVMYAYPELEFSPAPKKPNVLVIGDSFYWTWHQNKVPLNLFDSTSAYWYYMAQVYGNRDMVFTSLHSERMKEEIEKRDIVILLCTEGNMSLFPFGFTEKLSKIYHIKN